MSERVDFYFYDEAPDGRHEYHLQRNGSHTAPQLFRDEKPIREVLDPTFVKRYKLLEDMMLKLLEHFVINSGRPLSKVDDFPNFGDIQTYLSRFKKLFNDFGKKPRVIKKAGKGAVVFSLAVRRSPSDYLIQYRTDMRDHWKPKAMGSGSLFHEGRWYFSGRETVLKDIIDWLQAPASGAVARVLLGDPGVGKSAVLGFLVTCADAEERLLNILPATTVPIQNRIHFAINLKDRTLNDVLRCLSDRFGLKENVVAAISQRPVNTVLLFDSLEESADPTGIARDLIRPLIGHQQIWVLIGVRRSEISQLGASLEILDLNSPNYRSDTDVINYVERLLIAAGETTDSPFRTDTAKVRRYAKHVAAEAQGNFLVAFIRARQLIEQYRGQPIPSLANDGQAVLRTPRDAFDEYLARLGERSGIGEARLRRSLIPLAYAQGRGLPREVWAKLTKVDVDEVLHLAKSFIAESYEDGEMVFRLYHKALAEALQKPEHELEEHRNMSEKLREAIPSMDWRRADRYTQKYLSRHAARAGLLDALLLDMGFLVTSDPDILLSCLDDVSSPAARRIASWYRTGADRFRLSNAPERSNYLELIALQHGAVDLAHAIAGFALPEWRAKWARFAPSTPHLALHAKAATRPIMAMSEEAAAYYDAEGCIVIQDLKSGQIVSRWRDDYVTHIAIGADTVIVARRYKDEATIKRMNWRTGSSAGLDLQIPSHIANITAIAIIDDRILVGSQAGDILVWSDDTVCDIRGRHWVKMTSEFGTMTAICSSGDHYLVSWSNGTVTAFDRNHPLGEYRGSFGEPVTALFADEDYLLAGGLWGSLMLWDRHLPDREPQCLYKATGRRCIVSIAAQHALIADRDRLTALQWRTGRVTERVVERRHQSPATIGDAMVAYADNYGRLWRWDLKSNCAEMFVGQDFQTYACFVNANAVVAVTSDGAIRIWNVTKERSLSSDFPRGKSKLEDSTNCACILANQLISGGCDAKLQSWNLESGASIATRMTGHEEIASIASDGSLVISGGVDGTVGVWDAGLRPIRSSFLLEDCVTSVAISRGLVAAGGKSGNLRVFDLKTGRILRDFHGFQPITGLSLADSSLIYCGGRERLAVGHGVRARVAQNYNRSSSHPRTMETLPRCVVSRPEGCWL